MKTLIQDHIREESFIMDEVEHCAVVDDIFCEDALFPGMFGKERKDKEWGKYGASSFCLTSTRRVKATVDKEKACMVSRVECIALKEVSS